MNLEISSGTAVVLHLNGEVINLRCSSIDSIDGVIHLSGTPTESALISSVNDQKDPAPEERPRVRSYENSSALVRFMHEGRFCTAAVTHVTDRAWRLFNLALGAAWIPKSVLRWSPVAEQFCVVDKDYYPVFTQEISDDMRHFPEVFNPEPLIEELER